MTQPLALLFYYNLLPGTQLVNRMQDLGYRVQIVSDPSKLVAQALQEKPIVVVADLSAQRNDLFSAIRELRDAAATQHIPVLAYARQADDAVQAAARTAGANLVALEDGLLAQLPQLLDQVLAVD